jgi:hypothetical protein
MSLLPTTYNIFFNIHVSRLNSYIDEFIGDHIMNNYWSDILYSLDTGEEAGV